MSIKKMLNKKQHQMFNVEEREKFKFRKSKKYKNLCSVAIGILSISGLATGVVSADETTVAVTPATNLVEVQPPASPIQIEIEEAANTTSGVLSEKITSPALDEAVVDAKTVGVVVSETEAVVTETIESANQDLANQISKVKDASTTQKAIDAEIKQAVSEATKVGVEVTTTEPIAIYTDNTGAALKDSATQAGEIEAASKAQVEIDSSIKQAFEKATESGVKVSTTKETKYKNVEAALNDMADQVGKLTEATTTQKTIEATLAQAVLEAEKAGISVKTGNVKTYSDLKAAIADMQAQVAELNASAKSKEKVEQLVSVAVGSAKVAGIEVNNSVQSQSYSDEQQAVLEAQKLSDALAQAIANQSDANSILEKIIAEAASKHTVVKQDGKVIVDATDLVKKAEELKEKVEAVIRSNQEIAERNKLAAEAYSDRKKQIEIQNAQIVAENQKAQEDFKKAQDSYLEAVKVYEKDLEAAQNSNSTDATEIEKRNAAKKAAYEKALAEYEKGKASFDKALAEAKANVDKDGYLREVLLQGLKFEDEAEAEISVEGARFGTANLDVYRNGQQTANVQKIWYDIADVDEITKKVYGSDMSKIPGTYEYYVKNLKSQYDILSPLGEASWHKYIRGPQEWNNSSSYQLVPSDSAYSTTPVMLTAQGGDASIKQGVLSILKPNESATATYTNLTNSSYLGEPIDKVTVKVTNKGSATGSAFFAKNPSGGISTNAPSGLSDFNIELQFYRKDGSLVEATKDYPMIIGLSSLSRYDEIGWSDDDRYIREGYTREGITNISFRPVFYNGSGIVVANNLEDMASHLGMRYDGNNLFSDGKSLGKDTLPTPFYFYGENYINMGIIPDDFNDPDFYKIGFVGVQESGNKISFNMTRDGRWNYGYWMSLTTKVPNNAVIFNNLPPKEPEYETPATTKTPEPPVAPTPPKDKPIIPFTEEEPTPDQFESVTIPTITARVSVNPIEITSEKHKIEIAANVHDVTMVVDTHNIQVATTVHDVLVNQKPLNTKTVTSMEMVNLDGKSVPKGSTVVFELINEPLRAGRKEIIDYTIREPFPKGITFSSEEVAKDNPDWILASDENGVRTLSLTKKAIDSINLNRNRLDATIPVYRIVGQVENDGATYRNTFDTTISFADGSYKTASNTVTVSTPERPQPSKVNTNAAGVNINGKVVPVGSTNYYQITLDYDQYHAVVPDTAAIQRGFGGFDDYPEDALIPDLTKVSIVDSDGKMVSGVKLADNRSIAASDQLVKEHLSNSGIGQKIKGAFISILAENPQAYYDNIIKAKKSVTITIPMQVKDSLYNTGQSYSNTAYQLDFGNGYMTNTVSNTTPVVEPSKVNTNAEGININGKYVLANSVNYYKVDLNYSAYKGIEADANLIALGFFGVDDLPEEALNVEMSGIQFHASDNTVAKGITSTIYKNIAEAPKVLQDALAKRNFAPKGAVLVMSADDPKAYYDTYVKTGMSITATLPMTVKAELAKTGGKYENTAYQVDFGSAYITETTVNNVPKLDPKKDVVIDLSHDAESLAGQDIEVGTIFNYKLSGSQLPSDRGSEIFDYSWTDDYDEKHDQYDGVYKVFTPVVVEMEDGTIYEKGTELTRFSVQTVDTVNGIVHFELDEEFLRSIKDISAFEAVVYMQVKRIATGDVSNTQNHSVNNAKVDSNTVVTHTPIGNVIVKFLEDGTNAVLKPQVIDEQEVATGTVYETTDHKVTEILTKDGKTYDLVRHEGNETGKVVKGDTVITYFYKEVLGDVVVNYKDTNGKVIKESVTDTPLTSTGTAYDTKDNKPETIVRPDGSSFRLVPAKTVGAEEGKIVRGRTEVTYVYEEILGSVSVGYTDKDGNVIKEPVVDTPTGSTGRDYDTTDNKPKEIVTKDGKTYQIVPELTKGNEKGKVVEGDTKITYVYEEIKADVIVHYVDEAGNVIKKPVKDTEQASTGTDYDTTDNKPEYIDVDGVRYKLMPKKTIGNETGKLTKEGAEVTYVYHKIVTNWVTEEDRKPLKPQEDGEKEKGSFEGRIFVVTEVDPETGDITHVFKKVPAPTPTPQTPKPPVTPAPVTPPAAPVVKSATLPATGEVESSVLTAAGLAVIAASAGLTVTKRRKEDN